MYHKSGVLGPTGQSVVKVNRCKKEPSQNETLLYVQEETVSQPRGPQFKVLEPSECEVPTTNQQIAS